MQLALALAALLLAASPDEGRGGSGTIPEVAQSMRSAPRWRAGVSGAGIIGFANYWPSGGFGVALDSGIVLGDRFSLLAHGEVGTVVLTLIGTGAVLGEYAFNDSFSAGLGVGFSAWAILGSAAFYGLTFPLRVSWMPYGRAPHETRRAGMIISFQVAPGFSVQPTYFPQVSRALPPEAGVTAMLSVGYALW